jgi:hypothetical protein
LNPYLSLNRSGIFLTVDRKEAEKIVMIEGIEGVKEMPYSVPVETSIIVDDLDSGFSVIDETDNKGFLQGLRKNEDGITDQGLPVTGNNRAPGEWSRVVYTTAYGKYRQTYSIIGKGKGEKKAMLSTEIKKTGQYDLEIHLPWKPNIMQGKKWGTYYLTVMDGNGDNREIEFDSNAAAFSWNLAGNFYLPEGKTTVTISNKTDGDMVVVDAIKWTPSYIEGEML